MDYPPVSTGWVEVWLAKYLPLQLYNFDRADYWIKEKIVRVEEFCGDFPVKFGSLVGNFQEILPVPSGRSRLFETGDMILAGYCESLPRFGRIERMSWEDWHDCSPFFTDRHHYAFTLDGVFVLDLGAIRIDG